MYFVLISVILKLFVCQEHRNLVFPGEYLTTATLLAGFWSNPENQLGTYIGTLLGATGTTCLLRYHTYTLHTPLAHSCNWYIGTIAMADEDDPPRYGGAGIEEVLQIHQPQQLDFLCS